MTNKESIQARHLETISANCYANDTRELCGEYSAADSCTTITAEAIGEAMEWLDSTNWKYHHVAKIWCNTSLECEATKEELIKLFLNQKAKI